MNQASITSNSEAIITLEGLKRLYDLWVPSGDEEAHAAVKDFWEKHQAPAKDAGWYVDCGLRVAQGAAKRALEDSRTEEKYSAAEGAVIFADLAVLPLLNCPDLNHVIAVEKPKVDKGLLVAAAYLRNAGFSEEALQVLDIYNRLEMHLLGVTEDPAATAALNTQLFNTTGAMRARPQR